MLESRRRCLRCKVREMKKKNRIDVRAHDRARTSLPPRDKKGRFRKKKKSKRKKTQTDGALELP